MLSICFCGRTPCTPLYLHLQQLCLPASLVLLWPVMPLHTLQGIDSRGLYSDSVPEVKGFYQSYSFIDDLAWAAAWLAVRTGQQEDIDSARFYMQQHISEEAGGDRRRCARMAVPLIGTVDEVVCCNQQRRGCFGRHTVAPIQLGLDLT